MDDDSVKEVFEYIYQNKPTNKIIKFENNGDIRSKKRPLVHFAIDDNAETQEAI